MIKSNHLSKQIHSLDYTIDEVLPSFLGDKDVLITNGVQAMRVTTTEAKNALYGALLPICERNVQSLEADAGICSKQLPQTKKPHYSEVLHG